ncbi:MAG: hypothetical protein IJ794_19955 [Lachnospiraceae bacterium]|nr:hypothetical protein [Lachnospiraceae bacterium]
MNNPYMPLRMADNDLEFLFCEIRVRLLKRKIIKYLEESDEREWKEIADYLRKNTIAVFPYPFANQYKAKDVQVGRDSDTALLFVQDGQNRIYMRRKYGKRFRARRYYNGILLEQDKNSPHRYVSEEFYPPQDCIILDIGGAEGYFGLQYVNVAKKIYIFECDNEWEEALQCTYRDYGDKVQIVHSFVSDHTDMKHIRLDDFIRGNGLEAEKLFIKVDAEGAEPLIVDGLRNTLEKSTDLWLALCTYHASDHEQVLREKLQGCEIEQSEGYMLCYYDFYFQEPYLRRGVLRARKLKTSKD